jgi:hypothetical protein
MLTMGVLLGSEEHPFDMRDLLREFPVELTRCEEVIRTWWQSVRMNS